MAKIKGQLEGAQLHNKSTDPTNLPEGLTWLNTTTSKAMTVIGGVKHFFVFEAMTQTLTNKTIDGQNNTVQNLPLSSTITDLPNANNVLRRNASGVVVADKAAPTGNFVGTTDTQTLTNKTLTTPAISSPTGLVKADVGLSNVDNTSDANKPLSTADIAALAAKASLTGAETLTNKTLTAPIIDAVSFTDQGSTPATPAVGTHKAYVKSTTGKLTILDSSGTETTVGTGSGGGATNFIGNTDAESGTTGYAYYVNTAQAAPVNGTGGSSSFGGISTTTTNPLTGGKSFLISKLSGNYQGQGVSYDFTISNACKAKVLQISFDYMATSANFAAGTSSTDSDVTVWIYDVTNGTIIQPSSYKLLSNSTTISSQFNATFQTASNSTSYRLIFHIATTNASTWSLELDSISVSPSTYVYGTPVTDWTTYTPTFGGMTASSSNMRWRRVGDSIELSGTFLLSAVTAARAQVSLPAGLTVDSNIPQQIIGSATRDNGSTTVNVFSVVAAAGLNYVGFGLQGVSGNNALAFQNANNIFFTDTVSFFATVKVQGWSSSVQTSDQTDTRVVAALLSGSTTSISSGGNAITPTTVVNDTHGAFSGSTFTVPVPGFYKLDAFIMGPSASYSANQAVQLTYKRNGGAAVYIGFNRIAAATTSSFGASGTSSVYCNAGDTLQFFGYSDVTGNTTQFNASIQRISGPSAIAASESVAVRYYTSAGQTTAASTDTVIDFGTKDYDSHGCVTTGAGWKFTAPIAGKYRVSAMLVSGNNAWSASQIFYSTLYKNGTGVQSGSLSVANAAGTFRMTTQLSSTIALSAGDYIDFRLFQSLATSIFASALHNYICIERVGN